MKNKEKSFIVLIVLVVLALFLYRKQQNTTEYIREDYTFTKSKIIRAYQSDGGEVWMEYEYYVNGVKYRNLVAPSTYEYYDCYKDFEICDTVEFWVIYSNKDPKRSMIDMTASIVRGEDPKRTRNIVDFEL
jgi:hypothetical protein